MMLHNEYSVALIVTSRVSVFVTPGFTVRTFQNEVEDLFRNQLFFLLFCKFFNIANYFSLPYIIVI